MKRVLALAGAGFVILSIMSLALAVSLTKRVLALAGVGFLILSIMSFALARAADRHLGVHVSRRPSWG